MKKIIITGGQGRFASNFKKFSNKFIIKFPKINTLNILNRSSLLKYLNKHKPDYVIHNAALSRPMLIHEADIVQSINKNIVGTCNVVSECCKRDIKLIYFSSNYVYPCEKGNYKETDPLLPKNNYAWSKLGGECAVQMYKNSLILRLSITEKPFKYKKAYTNIKSSFLYHPDAASIIIKLIDKKGIINIGGKNQSIFQFAKKSNVNVVPIKYDKRKEEYVLPKNSSLNLSKLKNILKLN